MLRAGYLAYLHPSFFIPHPSFFIHYTMMNSNNTNTNSNGNSNSNSTNHNYGLKYITFDEFGRPSWKRPETREESRQFAKDMNKLIKRAIRSYSYSYSYSYQQKTIFHARQTEYVQDKHVSSLFKRVMQTEAELKGIYITRRRRGSASSTTSSMTI